MTEDAKKLETLLGMPVHVTDAAGPDGFAIVWGEYISVYKDGKIFSGPLPGTRAAMIAQEKA